MNLTRANEYQETGIAKSKEGTANILDAHTHTYICMYIYSSRWTTKPQHNSLAIVFVLILQLHIMFFFAFTLISLSVYIKNLCLVSAVQFFFYFISFRLMTVLAIRPRIIRISLCIMYINNQINFSTDENLIINISLVIINANTCIFLLCKKVFEWKHHIDYKILNTIKTDSFIVNLWLFNIYCQY